VSKGLFEFSSPDSGLWGARSDFFPRAAHKTRASRSWCLGLLELKSAAAASLGAGARSRYEHCKSLTPRGAPGLFSLTNFLLLSPTRLQDVECFFLNKAELEAKVESLKAEAELLRMFYTEVRSLPTAPATICVSQLGFEFAFLTGQRKGGVTQGSGHPFG